MLKKNVRAVEPILSLTKTGAAPIAAIVSLLTIRNGGFPNNSTKCASTAQKNMPTALF